MEFDKPSTKYMFIAILVLFVGAIVTMGYQVHKYEAKSDATRRAEIQACTDLKVKFLDAVKIKDSEFYADQVFYIVKKGSQSAELQFPFKTHENIQIRCIDLEKTEDPYAGVVIIGN